KRKKWLKDQADCDLTGAPAASLTTATTVDEVVAALGRRVSPRSMDAAGTPRLMAPGALYLQPGEERRRTGSHYTPRELTEPIVRTTLRPVLEALGERPTPEQILDLKVCDPAMGSGAFLVETCRQLAERLVTAWEVHDAMPEMPPDEEPLLHARRLVAQRCLYGVDKNPFAVNLAKLSIWLVTLAKDHAFTFIDHALKHGDSLVGLTKKQIAAFHWKTDTGPAMDLFEDKLKQDIEEALGWRDALQGLDEGDYNQKKEAWWEAENALADARLIGDLAVAAFFGVDKDEAREELRNQYHSKVEAWRANEAHRHELEGIVEELRGGEKPVPPMHWEIEFPEVFGRENPGFDAMVGNPPFLGGTAISRHFGRAYLDWLLSVHEAAHGNGDLVAHFYRRAFNHLRMNGTFGLIATNTIGQGDTRTTGLRWICTNHGEIYSAQRRLKWPGLAAVVVSVVHVHRGTYADERCGE
ncbi:MAG: N-6 DNA methylase, partial [Chloroflexi bacterium]|nr:N-6 DNA methylase [Chloroflexota bacterium]